MRSVARATAAFDDFDYALPAELSRGLRLPAPTSNGRLAIAIGGVVIGAALVAVYLFLTPPAPPAA